MSLTWNATTKEFVVVTKDRKGAEDAGLTRSTAVRGPQGEDVFFSGEAYAALPFYRDADFKAKSRLGKLYADYASSWAVDCNETFAAGQQGSTLKLRGYQNAGVAYGLKHRNVLIGDEMGIGKSAQAIAICNAAGAERVLVVCPASIRLNWRKEIKKWSTIPNPRCYPILASRDGVASWPNYTIISYEIARNRDVHAALRAIKWDAIIIDEAHFLKSHNAQRTHALFGGGRDPELKLSLSDRCDRIIALTGTPLPNRPRECFTLARALCHEAIDWMSFDDFSSRFNPVRTFDNGHEEELKGRLPELQARLRCNFMIRRLKKDVVKELPEKQYEFTYVQPNGDIASVIRKERMLDFDPKRDLKNPMAQIWGQISVVRREMGEAKLPRAVEHIKYLLDVEEIDKLVVFSHHRTVMDRLRAELEEYGVVEVRGGMGQNAKEASVQRFQSEAGIRIFSGQLDAAGFGIDGLQNVASRVVFIEPAWTPGTNDQAVDRLHRIGQQFPVLAQFLVVEGSLDERVLGTVLDKAYTINEALDQREAA